jgi:hypothetical protein
VPKTKERGEILLSTNEYRALTAIQCDLRQPDCGQCERLGVKCVGYVRERVFVNTTTQSSSKVSTVTLRNPLARPVYDDRGLKLSWSVYLPSGRALSSDTARDTLGGRTSTAQALYPTDVAIKACPDSVTSEARRPLALELMHRWRTTTYTSLCCLPEDGPFLQVELPRWAMTHEYLLHGIFALSLLEAVLRGDSIRSDASQARYVRMAMEYYDSSSAAFRAQLLSVRPDNIHILYTYSCMAVMVNMALFRCRYNDRDDIPQSRSMLQHMTDILELFMGCSWLADEHVGWLLESPMGPLVTRVDQHSMPAVSKPIKGPVDVALTRLMCAVNNSALTAKETDEVPTSTRLGSYQRAVTHLRACYAVSMNSEVKGVCGEFPSLAGREFTQGVKDSDPVALFILLHWAVLLQSIDTRAWWAGSFGSILVHEISSVLLHTHPQLAATLEWQEGIAWARDEVGISP